MILKTDSENMYRAVPDSLYGVDYKCARCSEKGWIGVGQSEQTRLHGRKKGRNLWWGREGRQGWRMGTREDTGEGEVWIK